MKADLENKLAESEGFFTEAGIVNRNMTSDEYLVGLHTLADIKVIVDTMRDSFMDYIIQHAISSVSIDSDGKVEYLYPDLAFYKDSINGLKEGNRYIEKELAEYKALTKTAEKLKFKPSHCISRDCYFIKDAVEASEREPEYNINRLEEEIEENNATIAQMEKMLENYTNISECLHMLHNIARYISGRENILSKLPNGYIFSDMKELLERIRNNSDFHEIADIYKYISQASMFEQYHNSLAKLATIDNELRIY